LVRGPVGTSIENLGNGQLLVEFGDDVGRVHAILPVEVGSVLVLYYHEQAVEFKSELSPNSQKI
jgi:hypothetical protein